MKNLYFYIIFNEKKILNKRSKNYVELNKYLKNIENIY